jgi:hypothetical protein
MHLNPSARISTLLWKRCSRAARPLPCEPAAVWLQGVSRLLLLQRNGPQGSRRSFRARCRQALAQSRWELSLLAMRGSVPTKRLLRLEQVQGALERALAF